MKRLLFYFLLLLSIGAIAQAPEAINYQTIVRTDDGSIYPLVEMDFKISILEGSATGSTVYSEEHILSTNANGMVSFKIGQGAVVSGSFSEINWGSDAHFIKIEARESGEPSYLLMGVEQFASVPYAFYAENTSTSNVMWQQNGDDIYFDGGNVGIKTNEPEEALTIGTNNRIQLGTTKNTLTYGAMINLRAMAEDAKPGIHFQNAAGESKAALSTFEYWEYPNEQSKRFSIATSNSSGELTERFLVPYGENQVDISIKNANLKLVDGNDFQVGLEDNSGLANYYGDVFIHGTNKLGVGDKDWVTNGTYDNAQMEVFRSSTNVEFLIHDDEGVNEVGLHLRNGEIDWKMLSDGDFRITHEGDTYFKINTDGDVGIDVEDPIAKLDVNGDVNVSSGFAYLVGGAGKGSYLPVEEALHAGDILGMNPTNGEMRKFKPGDIYMGVVVEKAGFVDNYSKDREKDQNYALVVSKGQVEVDLSQINLKGRMINIEGQEIGVLMANGKIYLK